MTPSFFDGFPGYEARAEEVLEAASLRAVSRNWCPFFFVAVALGDDSLLVLAVYEEPEMEC